MKLFLCGAAAPILVLALASFTPTRPTVGPLKLSDLTLDRVFRVGGIGNSQGYSVTAPATNGFVLTEVSMYSNPVVSNPPGPPNVLSIAINGVTVALPLFGPPWIGGPATPYVAVSGNATVRLDPPIVVHPNDTITIGASGGSIDLAGYVVYPGEI